MTTMKRFDKTLLSLLTLAFFVSQSLAASQAKRVYITLDVSGSMTGNKYVLANYTTQMITTLCEEDDDVYMIINGGDLCLSRSSYPLKPIQKPMSEVCAGWGNPSSGSQFADIIGFNKVYSPSSKKQNWLFVVGDGVWATQSSQYKTDREKFRKTVGEGTLNVCYLQTEERLNAHTDFTQFVDSLGLVDIRKSDINPATIKDGCDHFARKILGFSEIPLQVKQSGSKCISIKTELPVKEFYLVYQDEVRPSRLPAIETVNAAGATLSARLKGTPTTDPLGVFSDKVDLSGHVYHIKSANVIVAGTEITICFDKVVGPSKAIVYPVVDNVEFGSLSLTRAGGKLKRIDSRTSSICRDENSATVRIELNQGAVEALPESLLSKTKVVVKANSRDYEAKYMGGGIFESNIDLLNEETQYYAECDCPGYFKRVTPIFKIVKGDCEPQVPLDMEVREMPVADLGDITFEQLKRDNIEVYIKDGETQEAINSDLFDVKFEIENSFLYEEPRMHIENDTLIVLEVRPKGEWCECLFPETLNIKMISTPKEEAFEQLGKRYRQTVFPITLKVVKDRPWLSRCLWVLLTLIGLLLLFLYLLALQKKNRFKKEATVSATYFDYYGNKRESEAPNLRREGFAAWFSRWLIPGDERTTLSFDKPTISMRFIAADSVDSVLLPKDGNIDPETMRISGYDSKRDTQPKKPFRLSSQGKIRVLDADGNDEGYLVFTSGEATDGAAFRVIVALLMVGTAAAFLALLYFVVTSFL